MQKTWAKVLGTAALAIGLWAGPAPVSAGVAGCTGDCDDDKIVGIAELITMVNIVLGAVDLDECRNGDRDGDGAIEIDELVRGVGHALGECEDDVEPRPYKTRIDHPTDDYLAFPGTPDAPVWVKFTIRVSDPSVVYFQDSGQIPFHHDFVSGALEPYIGWTAAQIDAVSLHAEGQELVFGAVLYSPVLPHEIAIQLVRQDAYSVDEVVTYFNAVRNSIDMATPVPVLYFPTFEQQESASENSEALAEAGIALGSTARWFAGDVCYAIGWAHGRIVFVPGADIEDAYADGTLGPADILLTDGVPAEIPFVAGVMSLSASTPSSHVTILAGDWGIPFVFLSQPDSVDAAQALVGREVVLRATTGVGRFPNYGDDPAGCQVRLVDVTDTLEQSVEDHLRDLKRAPDLAIRPFQLSGAYAAEVDTATPDDIVKIGGKAANYGFLRRAVPANARIGLAFTFDLWSDYLDQEMEGGGTLRERIAALLAPFPTYPPADFEALYDALDEVRDLIDDEADFTAEQKTAILAALPRFTPTLPIRFRSSTNVEDSDVFTGAGLYESESGCFADEVDDDDEGPSRCDSTREQERGVFRALRKVFQSFYNDNAFLERLRHRVDESTVGMAVLVNHTFTDDTELANGVITLSQIEGGSAYVTIVSQPGAFSVTNPEDDGVAEVVEVYAFGDSRIPALRQGAERLPLGATVLTMPSEYVQLADLALEVGEAFGAFHGESQFNIEFEYKKITGEGLDLKQVRRIPRVTSAAPAPVLIDTPISLCTFQGEYFDLFANYRLKSRWQPRLVSGPVGDGALYTSATHQYLLDGAVTELAGAPASWPEAQHGTFEPSIPGMLGVSDAWTVGSGAARRRMTLKTEIPRSIGPAQIPIMFPEDLGYMLEAELDTPVPFIDFDGSVAQRSLEATLLHRCGDDVPVNGEYLLQERDFSDSGVTLETGFYWAPFPSGAVAGYTAPLDRWTETTITGVSAQSVALQGYFSQTYRPGHHNFSEDFLFDPFLEPDIDPAILAAWEGLGIRAVMSLMTTPEMMALTTDGQLVDLSELLD